MLITADLPGVQGRISERSAEEVLAKQPANTGDHWWLRIGRTGLSTNQVRAAVARTAHVPEDLVSCAGTRDRTMRLVQWFSVPAAAVDNPGALGGAGAMGKMRVLEITRSHKPVEEATVAGLRYKLKILGAAAGDGYRRAKTIMDRLRRQGAPNRIGIERMGPEGSLARYGQIMLTGGRLPASARGEPGVCLSAVQAWLFNRHLDARITDGLLHRCVPGEVMRGSNGQLFVAEDAEAAQKRLDSFECVQMGPLFGKGMAPAEGIAAERELATLAGLDLDAGKVIRLHGDRRPLRVQPTQTIVDLTGKDLILEFVLPVETYLGSVLDEIVRSTEKAIPEGEEGDA